MVEKEDEDVATELNFQGLEARQALAGSALTCKVNLTLSVAKQHSFTPS